MRNEIAHNEMLDRSDRNAGRASILRPVLDLDFYIPAYLTQLGNKWARSSSHLYMRRFGIGINEWRVMTMAAIEPGCSAKHMCAVLGMDKAAIGRSIQALEKKKVFRLMPHQSDGRSWRVSLTLKGWRLHKQLLELALARERRLLTGFSDAETRALISLLDRLRKNLVRVDPTLV